MKLKRGMPYFSSRWVIPDPPRREVKNIRTRTAGLPGMVDRSPSKWNFDVYFDENVRPHTITVFIKNLKKSMDVIDYVAQRGYECRNPALPTSSSKLTSKVSASFITVSIFGFFILLCSSLISGWYEMFDFRANLSYDQAFCFLNSLRFFKYMDIFYWQIYSIALLCIAVHSFKSLFNAPCTSKLLYMRKA